MQLYALVTEALAAASDSFLAGDRTTAKEIADRDQLIDDLYADIDGLVHRQFVLQAPVASELRYLLAVLRLVPELERSGDLAEHIATRGARGLGMEITPVARGIIEQMGQLGVQMWRAAAEAFAKRDGTAVEPLNELDDQLDELHKELMTELGAGGIALPAAVEMGLVARFFERLGDHALHVTERVRYLAGDSYR